MAVVNGQDGFTQYNRLNVTETFLVNGSPINQNATELIEVLSDFSVATQAPSGTDTPLQVEFGAASGGGSDPASLDASGNITINEAGNYELVVLLFADRSGSNNYAELWGRILVNGSQVGLSVTIELDTDDMGRSQQFGFLFSGTDALSENDVITVEIVTGKH